MTWWREKRLAALEKLVLANNDKLIEIMKSQSKGVTVCGHEVKQMRQYEYSIPQEFTLGKEIPVRDAIHAIFEYLGIRLVCRNRRTEITVEKTTS